MFFFKLRIFVLSCFQVSSRQVCKHLIREWYYRNCLRNCKGIFNWRASFLEIENSWHFMKLSTLCGLHPCPRCMLDPIFWCLSDSTSALFTQKCASVEALRDLVSFDFFWFVPTQVVTFPRYWMCRLKTRDLKLPNTRKRDYPGSFFLFLFVCVSPCIYVLYITKASR